MPDPPPGVNVSKLLEKQKIRDEVSERSKGAACGAFWRPRGLCPCGRLIPVGVLCSRSGEVSERSKERDWKSRTGRKVRRGFKSRPLRLVVKARDAGLLHYETLSSSFIPACSWPGTEQ
jgi:hypothetical protein